MDKNSELARVDSEFWRTQSDAYKHQMEVNNNYAQRYEAALSTICELCGEKPDTGGCYGVPTPDVDARAIEYVKRLLNK